MYQAAGLLLMPISIKCRRLPLQLHVRQTHKAKSKKGTDFVYLVQASWRCISSRALVYCRCTTGRPFGTVQGSSLRAAQ